MARSLTGYTEISANQENSNVRNSLFAIHGIELISAKNIKSTLLSQCLVGATSVSATGFSGYTGYIIIDGEILNVTSANTSTLIVERAKLGTVAKQHESGVDIFTITVMSNVENYSYSEKTDISDNDLFGVSIDGGNVTLIDLPSNWNSYSTSRLYNWVQNKECFLFEGVNRQYIKVYDGLLFNKRTNSKESRIFIDFKNPIYKYFNNPISVNTVFDNVTIEYVLETLFTGYNVVFPLGLTNIDFLKVYNLYTKEYATYGDLLKYICKEAMCRIRFRQDKTILLFSDLEQAKLTTVPNGSIQANLVDINDDTGNQLIINTVKGTYIERKELYNMSDFYDGVNYRSFKWNENLTLSGANTPLQIISNWQWKTITISNMTPAIINLITYGDYVLLTNSTGTKEYWCKVSDFTVGTGSNGTIELITGIDKPSYFNESGRLHKIGATNSSIEGTDGSGNLSLTSAKLYIGKTELPIITKLIYNVNGKDKDSNLMKPIIKGIDETFYLKYGCADNNVSKFSGVVKGLESLLTLGFIDNTKAFYNREYSQIYPIFMYSNKVDGIGNITTVDNADMQVKVESSDLTDSDLKITLRNAMAGTPITTTITPTFVSPSGIYITSPISANIGDVLVLSTVISTDGRYGTYLAYKNVYRTVLLSEANGASYNLYLDYPYPQAVSATYLSSTKYLYSDCIFLNELYFRGNPVMQTEQNINETSASSVLIYGEKPYEIDGKFMRQDDLQKAIAYYLNSYSGVDSTNTRLKLTFELPKRLDLEAGDTIVLSDTKYTGLSNQRCVIISKDVKENRTRQETYEALTVGNYTISASSITLKTTLKYSPATVTSYSHRGNEGNTTDTNPNGNSQSENQIKENKITLLQDDIEGTIQVEIIPTDIFSALTDLTSTIRPTDLSLNILLKSITSNLSYTSTLLDIGREGVINIGGEYMTYQSTANVTGSATTIKIIRRGLFKTEAKYIFDDTVVQFFKILSKVGKEGLITNSIDVGDGSKNYIKMKALSDSNMIYLNSGQQQLGSSVVDTSGTYRGFFVGDTTLSNNKYLKYDATSTGKLEIKTATGYIGSTTNYFDITNGYFRAYKDVDNFIESTASTFQIKTTTGTLGSGTNYFNIGTGLIYLNSGQQQIGTGVVDYLGATPNSPYNGMFMGDKNLLNENYIRFTGSEFNFGENVRITGVLKSGDKVVIKDVGLNDIVKMGEVASGIFGLDITFDANNYFTVKDAGATSGIRFKSTNVVDISNGSGTTLNHLYFSPTASTSYLSLNGGTQQLGLISGLTGKADFSGIFVGTKDITLSSSNYFYYDGTDMEIYTRKLKIVGTTGSNGIAIGYNAGSTYLNNNIAIGNLAMTNTLDYGTNIAIGALSMAFNGAGQHNIAIGSSSLQGTGITDRNAGSYNIAIGESSLYTNDSGNYDISIGYNSMIANTTGSQNIAMGYKTLYTNTTGEYNIAIGSSSLYVNTTGSYNVGIGYQTLYNTNPSGINNGKNNIAMGYKTLYSNTIGHNNTSSGYMCLYTNTTGDNNVAYGSASMYTNLSGNQNVAFGSGSLYTNSTGNGNVAIGKYASYYNISTHNSVAVGFEALLNNVAAGNVSVGAYAGQTINNSASEYNTFIGFSSGYHASQKVDATNSMALGNGTYTTASNQVVIGNTNITETILQGKVICNGVIRCKGYTTTERDALTAVAGDIIFLTDSGRRFQGYDGYNWYNLS